MAGKPESIDQYLAGVEPEKRAALEALRRMIHTAAPGVEETISYGIPHFRLDGAVLMAFGAAAKHCAIYPCSSTAVAALTDDLKGFDTSPGTVRFKVDAMPSDALVRKIIAFRKAENAAIAEARAAKRKR